MKNTVKSPKISDYLSKLVADSPNALLKGFDLDSF